MAARLPREGAFAPNVVVTIEPCGPTFRVEDSLEQIATMATSRGGAVSEPYAAELGGAQFVGCDATWPDPDVETVLQANLFHVVPPAGPRRRRPPRAADRSRRWGHGRGRLRADPPGADDGACHAVGP